MNFDELDKRFERFMNDMPSAKRKLVESCGEKMNQKVLRNIEISVKSKSGNLKKGVTKVIGSGGGYAAVKPDYKIAPHTHLIENGHKLIKGKGANGRIVGWSPGVHMYRNALSELADELQDDAERMINELVGDIFD